MPVREHRETLDFRIFLVGGPILWNDQTWTYINSTEANCNALVASALAAKAAGDTVVLHVELDSGSGYCHLDYMDVE